MLLLGTLQGIVVAIIVSLLALASQTAHPPVYVIARKPGADVLRPLSSEHPDDETFEGLLILRPEGRLFFINAEHVAAQMRELTQKYQPRVILLDMSRVPDMEYSALQMLIEGERRVREQGLELWLADLSPRVLETVRHTRLPEALGPERLLFNTRVAIARYQQQQATTESKPANATPES